MCAENVPGLNCVPKSRDRDKRSVGEQRVRAEAEAEATVDCTGERMPA